MQILQTIPANTPALKGAVWDGSQFLDTRLDGQPIHPFVNIRTRQGVRKWPLYYGTRQNSTAYTVGKRVSINTGDAELYLECEAAGTSAASDPTINYSQIGQTVVDGGVTWRVKGLHAYKGYENWPARTNKCECVKANPVSTTNLAKVGDAATLTVVDDSAEIAAAKLSGICSSGKVYKLDNSAGTDWARVNIAGYANNANPHALSCYIRSTKSMSQVILRNSSGTVIPGYSTSITPNYQRKEILYSTVASASVAQIWAPAGEIIFFILPQFEEGLFVTPPIIGDDSATTQTRAETDLSMPSSTILLPKDFGLWGWCIPRIGGSDAAGLYLCGSVVDAENFFGVYARSVTGNITMRKTISGNNFLADSGRVANVGKPFQWQVFVSSVYGSGARVHEAGGIWNEWVIDPDNQGAPLSSMIRVGGRGDGYCFPGSFPAIMPILSSDPKAELERLTTLYG